MSEHAPITIGNVPLKVVIRSQLPAWNSAERMLGTYIVEHTDEVPGMTMQELAQASETSTSTVTRLCLRLGLDGMKGLKKRLREDAQNTELPEEDFARFEITQGDSYQDICSKIFHLSTSALQDCARLIRLSDLEKAVGLVTEAKRIVMVGSGASAAAVMYAHTRFLRTGIPCSVESDATMMMMQASMMHAGDVLLAISSSGRTACVVEAATLAHQNGASVISLTDFLASPLQKQSQISLYTTSRNAASSMDIDMPLTVSQVAILDILYSCCMAHLGDHGRQNYLRTKKAIETQKSPL